MDYATGYLLISGPREPWAEPSYIIILNNTKGLKAKSHTRYTSVVYKHSVQNTIRTSDTLYSTNNNNNYIQQECSLSH